MLSFIERGGTRRVGAFTFLAITRRLVAAVFLSPSPMVGAPPVVMR